MERRMQLGRVERRKEPIYSTLYHVSWIPELIKTLKAEEQGEKDTEEIVVADTEDVLEERQNTGYAI